MATRKAVPLGQNPNSLTEIPSIAPRMFHEGQVHDFGPAHIVGISSGATGTIILLRGTDGRVYHGMRGGDFNLAGGRSSDKLRTAYAKLIGVTAKSVIEACREKNRAARAEWHKIEIDSARRLLETDGYRVTKRRKAKGA